MDGSSSSVSVLCYRTSKPLGKVRRRVQELRVPSSGHGDPAAARPALDLSHNESARLAVDCLLSQGLKGYHEALSSEGEADFLSELEKNYILENGRDGNTADPGASDVDDYKVLESSSAGSQSDTQCPAVSTGRDSEAACVGQSNIKDMKWADPVLGEPRVYFPSDRSAAGMKDLVREFIRNATMALAIVIDSFTDVELLCDILEASRKRNVSVHLLLDHVDLDLFVAMWQDLKLDGKNFPKLSVRSVDGQTYCAKTGRKLTGRVAESFIIKDWTEVLTGSYSFSWLSWQVHRSLVVHVKGGSVAPFHHEFHRLDSSSKPVPSFVTFITVPHILPLYVTSRAAQHDNTGAACHLKSRQAPTMGHWAWYGNAQKTQTTEKTSVLSNPKSPALECNKYDNQLLQKVGTAAQIHTKPPPLYPKLLFLPRTLQCVSVEESKHTVMGVPARHDAKAHEEPAENNQNPIPSYSKTLGPTQVSYDRCQFANAKVQESNPIHAGNHSQVPQMTVCYQSTLKNSNLDHDGVGTEGFFFQQRNRNRLTKPPGISAAGLNTQRGQWNYSCKLKVEVKSDDPKILSPPTSQQKQAKTGPQFPSTHSRGHISGLQTNIPPPETRRPDQLQSQRQTPGRTRQPPTEAPGSKLTSTATGTQPRPRLQAHPGQNMQPHTSQQAKPPPRLNWIHTARPRPVARTSSFDTPYGTGQMTTGGRLGWRPAPADMNTLLRRSKSLTDRRSAGFNQNMIMDI